MVNWHVIKEAGRDYSGPTKFCLWEISKIRCIGKSRVPQFGELLGHILDDEDSERVGTKGLLEGLKGDAA